MGTAKKVNTANTVKEVKVLVNNASELFAKSLKFDRIETSGLVKQDNDIVLNDKAIALLAEQKGTVKNSYPIDIEIEVVSYQATKTVQNVVIPAKWNDTGLTFTLKAGIELSEGLKSLAKFIRNAQKKQVKSSGLGVTLADIETKLTSETDKAKITGLKYLQRVFTKNFGTISLSINGAIWGGLEVHKGTALSAPERAFGIASLMLGKTQAAQEKFNEQFYTVETKPETVTADKVSAE